MADENNAATDPVEDPNAAANQTPPADTGASENPPAGGSRTYSQEEHDKIVKARIDKARKKHDAEVASLTKSEQAAIARAEKAEARVQELEDQNARSALIARVAGEKGVDQGILAKMTGSTEEEIAANADIIAAAIPKAAYPNVADNGGDANAANTTTKEAIMAIKNPKERLAAIAANKHLF